ncbi:hypothetical protein JMJ77_0002821 [Colletotrichum scovillei]|uniref:Uncharacterized protein n=1 Tax=Colletotrichum scovillei TaxID=1209932 RepID=A0A9P7QVU9_9PEZI|nr:hypothetical protein JMJ78_0006031 [Colletotrichum scovillei]KAG7043110.1 hypothetical protein JMJ77_0002821 [Colletotrichum scovillei]KAG7062557.1 hypothetical protein JMJ76_0009405 [Colletotrichum scovillei]
MADRDIDEEGEPPRALVSCAKSQSPTEPSSKPTDLVHARSDEPAAEAASEEPPVLSQPMSSPDATVMAHESQEDMTQRIHEAYSSSILYEERNHLILNIATLQQMHLEYLRQDIGKRGFNIFTSSPNNTEKSCRALGPAIKGYDM